MAAPNEALDILHDLIETCRDGEDGYLHAAALVSDPGTQSYFKQQSLERACFVRELRDAARRLGEREPDTSGTVTGTLHRAWFEAKVDAGLGDSAVLSSVELGEDSAKKSYEKALEALLPDNVVRELVKRQAQSVFAAHDRARDIRDRQAA